jgi:hypothetical protein
MIVALFFSFLLVLLLAADGQHISMYGDVDVFGFAAGDLGLYYKLVLLFSDVNRRPAAAAPDRQLPIFEETSKKIIDLVVEPRQRASFSFCFSLSNRYQCHSRHLLSSRSGSGLRRDE